MNEAQLDRHEQCLEIRVTSCNIISSSRIEFNDPPSAASIGLLLWILRNALGVILFGNANSQSQNTSDDAMGCVSHFIPIRRRRNLAHSMLRLSNFDLFSLSTFLQNRTARNVFDCIRRLTIQRREIGITPHYTRELKKLAAMSNSKAAAKNAIKRGWKGWRNETRTARRKTGRLFGANASTRKPVVHIVRFSLRYGVWGFVYVWSRGIVRAWKNEVSKPHTYCPSPLTKFTSGVGSSPKNCGDFGHATTINGQTPESADSSNWY